MKKVMVGLLLLAFELLLVGCGADTSGISVTCNGPNGCAPLIGVGSNISDAGGLSSTSPSFILNRVRSGGVPVGGPGLSTNYKLSVGENSH